MFYEITKYEIMGVSKERTEDWVLNVSIEITNNIPTSVYHYLKMATQSVRKYAQRHLHGLLSIIPFVINQILSQK